MTADPPRLKFVTVVSNGKGGRFHYFRSPLVGHIRLKGTPGTSEFHAAYTAALQLHERLLAGVTPEDRDSFAWLVKAYLKSAEYRALADSTQVDYARTCALITDELGDQPFKLTTRAMLKAVRDDYADTARKANKVTAMLSALYSWAQQGQLVPDGFNPAAGLKKVKRKGGVREYVPWSDPELDWYIAVAPMHALTPVLLALYTGQRREDVVSMTWQQDQGAIVRVRTSKTRELIDMPCHPALRAHLDLVRKSAKVVSLTGPICLGRLVSPTPSTPCRGRCGALSNPIPASPTTAACTAFAMRPPAEWKKAGRPSGRSKRCWGIARSRWR
jgi:integrase